MAFTDLRCVTIFFFASLNYFSFYITAGFLLFIIIELASIIRIVGAVIVRKLLGAILSNFYRIFQTEVSVVAATCIIQ